MAYTPPPPPRLIFKGRVGYVTHAYVLLSKADSLSLHLSICLSLLYTCHTHPHRLWVVYVVARDFWRPLMVGRENLWFGDLGIALAFFCCNISCFEPLCSFFSKKKIQYYMENEHSVCYIETSHKYTNIYIHWKPEPSNQTVVWWVQSCLFYRTHARVGARAHTHTHTYPVDLFQCGAVSL